MKKIFHGDPQPITELFNGGNRGTVVAPADNIVDSGLGDAAHTAEFVNGNIPLLDNSRIRSLTASPTFMDSPFLSKMDIDRQPPEVHFANAASGGFLHFINQSKDNSLLFLI